MGRVELAGLVLVCAGGVLFALKPEGALMPTAPTPLVHTQPQTAPKASVKQPQSQPRQPPSQTPSVTTRMIEQVAQPAAPTVDARYAQMNGLIGESGQWVSSVFDNSYWTLIEPNHFEHRNGSQLRLSLVGGHVTKIRMDFASDLSSPAMQTVLDYALGRATNAPFYLDTLAQSTEVLTGTFEHKNKHELRYTAGLEPTQGKKGSKAWLTIELVQ
jgi:hypothetical protein